MITVDYKDILDAAADMCGLVATEIDTQDSAILRRAISRSLEVAWKMEKWPDLLRCEERYLRDLYAAATAYAAKAEVYYPAEEKHYHALRASTGNLPTNKAYWAESGTSYSADDYSATKAYVAGDKVYYPDADKFYQCHTASTNNLPTNTSFWGELVPFVPYVAFEQTGKTKIGTVFGVWDRNPRVFTNADDVPFELSDVGVQMLEAVNKVWIEFRSRPPVLKGDVWSSTATYTVGQQVYFGSNFYDCATNTSAGESPTTAAAKWTLVEIPHVFKQFLAQAGFAGWLLSDGQNDKVRAELKTAESLLAMAADELFRQSGQVRRMTVLTR